MAIEALQKIIDSKRMPVLFIGSGLSRRYLYNFPDWETLLKESFKKINSDPFHYQKHYDRLNRAGLSSFEIYKELGSIAENEFNEAFYSRKVKINTTGKHWIETGVSPYKMYLALKFKKMKFYKSSQNLEEIKEFKKLKNKISAVITTNYDKFLESFIFDTDYSVYKRQYEMFSASSYNIAEIYKIHGCITDADSIIITKEDYAKFETSRRLFIAKMLTLFAESPIIFLGYSFTDENIQKIVQDFLECLSPHDLSTIHEHLIFISWKKGCSEINEIRRSIMTSSGKEIPITELQTDNYLKIYQTLNEIMPGISPARIRETKRIVKKIVDISIEQGQETSLMVNIDDLDKISNTKALAIAVGYKSDFVQESGYKAFPESIIYEDILKDNQHLDPRKVCFDRYTSISHQRVLPIFKYAKKIASEISENERLLSYIKSKDAKEKILSKTLNNQIQNYPALTSKSEVDSRLDDYETINKKCMLILKNIHILTTDDIRNYCIYMFDDFIANGMKDTHFKRCVLYLDFLENYEEYKEKSSICNS